MSGEFRVSVPARWTAAAQARRQVVQWLHTHCWPPDDCDDVVFAVNEAVSNSIEHGYRVPPEQVDHPGVVEIVGHVVPVDAQGRCVHIEVRDFGEWRHERHDPSGLRSRGMAMMRAVLAAVTVDTGDGGTVVRLRGNPVPAV